LETRAIQLATIPRQNSYIHTHVYKFVTKEKKLMHLMHTYIHTYIYTYFRTHYNPKLFLA